MRLSNASAPSRAPALTCSSVVYRLEWISSRFSVAKDLSAETLARHCGPAQTAEDPVPSEHPLRAFAGGKRAVREVADSIPFPSCDNPIQPFTNLTRGLVRGCQSQATPAASPG